MEVDIMKKVIFLGVLLGLALIWFVFFRNPDKSEEAQIERLRTENTDLKQKLEKANEQLRPLEVENETLNKYLDEDIQAQYIEVTFPQDGNFYQADEDFEFYTDPECTDRIEGRPVIISIEVDEKTPYREEAYCVCLSTEGLIFSTSWPELYISN